MAEKLPIVYVDGALSQLPTGDSVDASELGSVIAVSGLVGGGDLNTGNKRLDVALATNPSGIIFVGDTVGYDGAALADADLALASGSQALTDANSALSVNTAVEELAETTLEFNNAVLDAAVNFAGSSQAKLVAGDNVSKGLPCGLNAAGEVETIRAVPDPSTLSNNPLVYPVVGQNPQQLCAVLNQIDNNIVTFFQNITTSLLQYTVGTTLPDGVYKTVTEAPGWQTVNSALPRNAVWYPRFNSYLCFYKDANLNYLMVQSFDSNMTPTATATVDSTGVLLDNFDCISIPEKECVAFVYTDSNSNSWLAKLELSTSTSFTIGAKVGVSPGSFQSLDYAALLWEPNTQQICYAYRQASVAANSIYHLMNLSFIIS